MDVVNSHKPSDVTNTNRDVSCPHCSLSFSRRGLGRHIAARHPQRLTDVHVTETSDLVTRVQQCLEDIRIFNIIPRAVRACVASALTDTVLRVVERNDLEAWEAFLAFAHVVLQMPKKQPGGPSLPAIIRSNLAAFKQGQRFEYRVLNDPRRPCVGSDARLAQRAALKLAEGDISGAARVLSSTDKFAVGPDVLAKMLEKHPSAPDNLEYPSAPENTICALTTRAAVLEAVRSFPNSSAAGPDGLRPRHLKDLLSPALGEVALCLADALARMADILRSGLIPEAVHPLVFGARLFALRKKDGSLRPIACSLVIRRLVSKIMVRETRATLDTALGPKQLGCGRQCGAEAGVHAARAFLRSSSSPTVLIKLDFRNAFNSLRRDHMLRAVKTYTPELFLYTKHAYQRPTYLLLGKECIRSESGVQQGDPLGPALFCLSIRDLVSSIRSQLNVWYMDDGTIGGTVADSLADLRQILDFERVSGLQLNPTKCEVYTQGFQHVHEAEAAVHSIRELLPGCRWTSSEQLELLGVPVLEDGLRNSLGRSIENTKVLLRRLPLLGSHQGLFLLRSSISTARLQHLLRGCEAYKVSDLLRSFDEATFETAKQILNLELTPSQMLQASLPISLGGLGLRQAAHLAAPAFVSSMSATDKLVSEFVSAEVHSVFKNLKTSAIEAFLQGRREEPQDKTRQVSWLAIVDKELREGLLEESADLTEKTRLLAVAEPDASAWLHAIPAGPLGTLLDNDSVQKCVGLRLGADIVTPHVCCCGMPVEANGRHGLSCARSAGRAARHAQINDTFARALRVAGIPCIREPTGLHRDDGKRPDGLTLIPYSKGKALVWDGTIVDTLAPSYVGSGTPHPGHAAKLAEQTKERKYAELRNTYLFCPLAFETLGGPGPRTRDLLDEVSKRLSASTGDRRAGNFLRQRLSLDVQRGNAASVAGTMRRWGAPEAPPDSPAWF